MNDWQYMDTAPEDGTVITILHEDFGELDVYWGDNGSILGPGWISLVDDAIFPTAGNVMKIRRWKPSVPTWTP